MFLLDDKTKVEATYKDDKPFIFYIERRCGWSTREICVGFWDNMWYGDVIEYGIQRVLQVDELEQVLKFLKEERGYDVNF